MMLKHLLWFAFVATVGRLRSGKKVESNPFGVKERFASATKSDVGRVEPSNTDGELLRSDDLDFVLYFGNEGLRPDIVGSARYGVWAFGHGDHNCERIGPQGFWEIAQRLPVTSVVLRQFTTDDPVWGSVLRQGFFPVMAHSYSRTVNAARWGSIDFPLLVCEYLLQGGSIEGKGERSSGPPTNTVLPGNGAVLSFVARMLCAKIVAMFYGLFTRVQWNVGLTNAEDLNPRAKRVVSNVQWLPGKGNKSFGAADPFVRRSKDGLIVLAETMDMKEQRGVIAASRVTGESSVSLGLAIEEKGVHLSYPYLLDYKGQIYCVPEQSESDAIVLYRAVDFPLRWQRVGHILSGVRAADSSLFRFGPYWWLAYTEVRPRSHDSTRGWPMRPDDVSRLMLWYTSELTGPWMPHACNPVKIDPRSSRGAGAPFYYEAMLVRPSQDCSVSYGAKIVFNRVITLTPTQFAEEVIGELRPDPAGPYPRGLHTLSCDGNVAVIDGLRRVFAPMAWWTKVRGRKRRTATKQSVEWHVSGLPGTSPLAPTISELGLKASADPPLGG
jgi:hypothetical protein